MSALTLWGCQFVLALALVGGQHPTSGATIPAPFPGPQPRSNLPIDQPPVVVHGERRHPPDVRRMKQQAGQLAKLAQSISPDINKAGKGEMPKELMTNLKKIEKLSKQLRRELGR
jgi:hypothetical protein